MANNTVHVNGNSTTGHPKLSTEGQITQALILNGGIKRIEATFRQRLDAAGWSQDLKEYCTKLFRSGEAVTYDDALTIIMNNVSSGSATTDRSMDGSPIPDLRIPDEARVDAAKVVRKELAEIVDMEK